MEEIKKCANLVVEADTNPPCDLMAMLSDCSGRWKGQ